MGKLNIQFSFLVPRDIIYDALTQPHLVMGYTRAPAQIYPAEGTQFTILDGKIRGKFLKLRRNEYIQMQWRLSEWEQPSLVDIILSDPEEDECDVMVNQNGIPNGENIQKIQHGWKEYYFGAMSKVLGYPLKE